MSASWIVSLSLAWAVAGPAPQDQEVSAYRRVLEAGDFWQAARAAEQISDPLARQRARVEARYWCGDLTGALSAVRQGLTDDPDDLQLLINGADLALQLLQIDEALEWSRRLKRVAAESSELPAESREFYAGRAAELSAQAKQLEQSQGDQSAALKRAKGTVGVVSLLALLLVALCRRPKQA